MPTVKGVNSINARFENEILRIWRDYGSSARLVLNIRIKHLESSFSWLQLMHHPIVRIVQCSTILKEAELDNPRKCRQRNECHAMISTLSR